MFATCFDGKLAREVESCPPCNEQSCGPLKSMVFDDKTGRCEVRRRQAPWAGASSGARSPAALQRSRHLRATAHRLPRPCRPAPPALPAVAR